MDPEQADFFYVPVYTSCLFHPVLGWADLPWYYGAGGTPSHAAQQTGRAGTWLGVSCDKGGLPFVLLLLLLLLGNGISIPV